MQALLRLLGTNGDLVLGTVRTALEAVLFAHGSQKLLGSVKPQFEYRHRNRVSPGGSCSAGYKLA